VLVDPLDGRTGEAWAGEAPDGAHVNVVVGRRGSPTGAAIVAVLGSPRPGHLPFLACLRLGEMVRPTTVIVTKNTLDDDRLARLTWGAAHLGVSQGVLDAVADGVLPAAEAADLVLLVPVWVDPAASDETALRLANRAATRAAIANAVSPPSEAAVRALAEQREQARNAYYSGT
jgi:5,6,7,8-tetrahydromethanopterin hydro-lyase